MSRLISFRAPVSWRLAALCVALAARPVLAQQLPVTPPTPDQARRLLETRPDLVAQLRREILNSGLTIDQVHARLRAAGYPEDLLDQYMSTRPQDVARDSLASSLPSQTVLDAVSVLGIADSVDTSELREIIRKRRATPRDSGRVGPDSMGMRVRDTVGRADARTDSVTWQTVVDSLGRLVVVPVRAPVRALRAVVDTGQTIFGLSVFENATTQFDANLAGPVDANYRIGPGDRLVLLITGDAERAFTLDVTREGFIVVPGIGELPAASLTMQQLEDLLYQKLGKVYSGLRRGAGATTHFSLNLARLHTNQIFVLGDVDQPGSYRVSSAGTALTALYAAGGPTLTGGMRRIEIRRAGRLVDSLDLYDYLLHADGSHDPRLQSGDVVFVPVHGPRVRAYGEVVRPGTYELRRGESLADLVRAAGGFTPEAARRVQISRILAASQSDSLGRARIVVDVNADARSADAPAVPLEPGDVVRVAKVAARVTHRVTVQGHVVLPGPVGYTDGMHLSDALRSAGGLQPDAYRGEVQISRLRQSDSVRVQLRTALDDGAGRPVDDMVLRDDDEVRVFSITELRGSVFIAINGAVRRPGRYPYREGMSLRDAILLAGGLDERASLADAEIARLPASRDGGRLATTQRVPLDSSYVLTSHTPGAGLGGVAQQGESRDVTLAPYDNVLIPVLEDLTQARRVVVIGEVRAPGTYTVVSKTERLSDVIQRAGGLTSAADPDAIVFYRHRDRIGRIGVDLPRVLRDPSSHDNLVLQDGDSVYLPQYAAIVQVQGAVNAPRGVAWVDGADLDYYVHAAGGVTHDADMSHAYVTQPDGNVESVIPHHLRPDHIPTPRAGAVVYVAERDQKDHTDSVARLGVLAQVLGGLVALVALLRQR